MRALKFDGIRSALERLQAAPVPARGEALVRPAMCIVSSADRAAARQGSGFIGTLGHQFVGKVESVAIDNPEDPIAKRAAALKGRRVVCAPLVSCGSCDLCRTGLSAHCRASTTIGLRGRDGGLADAVCVPSHNLIAVPDDVENERAVFAHLAGCAIHAAASFRVEGKPFVTVLGDGPLALLTVQAMSRLNASVRLLSWREPTGAACERWGIKHRPARDVGQRQDQDVVVDCTGEKHGFELACGLVRSRGRVVLKSESLAGPAGVELTDAVEREIQIVGSGYGSIGEGLVAIQKRHVQTEGLIARRVKLEDAEAALAASGDEIIAVTIDGK